MLTAVCRGTAPAAREQHVVAPGVPLDALYLDRLNMTHCRRLLVFGRNAWAPRALTPLEPLENPSLY